MIVTVVQWRPYSPVMKQRVLIELLYKYRRGNEAIEAFKSEYPEAKDDELTTLVFDIDERLDWFDSFFNTGCIRV